MKKSIKVTAVSAVSAVAIISSVATAALSVNLSAEKGKTRTLFNLHTAECEYARYEERNNLPEDFEYLITCEEATQYEMKDYINCEKATGRVCTLEDYL